MKQSQKLAEALSAVDIERKKCENIIKSAIGEFIKQTGVRPTGVDISIIDVSTAMGETREYICGDVRVEYDPDVRFSSA